MKMHGIQTRGWIYTLVSVGAKRGELYSNFFKQCQRYNCGFSHAISKDYIPVGSLRENESSSKRLVFKHPVEVKRTDCEKTFFQQCWTGLSHGLLEYSQIETDTCPKTNANCLGVDGQQQGRVSLCHDCLLCQSRV